MKILYDYQAFQMQQFGGISRYFYELLRKRDRKTWDLPIRYSNNLYINENLFGGKLKAQENYYEEFLKGKQFKGKWKLYKFKKNFWGNESMPNYNQRLSIEALQKNNFDIFHPTYYSEYFLNFIGKRPFVLTVFDMIHEILPEYFTISDETSVRKKILAEKASKILAISETTKNDLVRIFNIDEKKIIVTHLGNSLENSVKEEEIKTESELPKNFILYVGSRGLYKNFHFFVSSIASLLREDKSMYLVCTGNKFDSSDIAFFRYNKISDKVIHVHADDKILRHLYSKALALVFPSLYEGFGIPILEAFSCGCPIAVSNSGSLPEIGGDAAIYFDPQSEVSIKDSVSKIIYDKDLRNRLREKGYERLKNFSWDKTYEDTVKVYESIL